MHEFQQVFRKMAILSLPQHLKVSPHYLQYLIFFCKSINILSIIIIKTGNHLCLQTGFVQVRVGLCRCLYIHVRLQWIRIPHLTLQSMSWHIHASKLCSTGILSMHCMKKLMFSA